MIKVSVEIVLDEENAAVIDRVAPVAGDGLSRAERDAAWEAFKALTRAGWRSDLVKSDQQDRDELHRR